LAGLLVLALAATGVAMWQRQASINAQRLALSRQLAAQSQIIGLTDPVTARRLAAAAWRIAPTDQARDSMTALLVQQRGLLVDQTVRLWDPATGNPAGAPIFDRTGPAYAVAFSRDGARLATADRTAQLWDLSSRQQHGAPLTGQLTQDDPVTDVVLAVAFSPD